LPEQDKRAKLLYEAVRKLAGHVRLNLVVTSWWVRFHDDGYVSRFIGNTLRGGFGKSLRELCCPDLTLNCRDCLIGARCAYGYLFESVRPPDAPIMRKYPHVPHPFVFHLPRTAKSWVDSCEPVALGMTLVGRGADFFPFVLLALQRLGSTGLGKDAVKFDIEKVETEDGQTVFRHHHRGPVRTPQPRVMDAHLSPTGPAILRLRLLTPLRLRVRGVVLREFDFRAFVSAALRRLELLIRLHDPEGVFELDVQRLLRAAEDARQVNSNVRWVDLERWSRRQGRAMPLGGLVGEMEVEADSGLFVPLLRIASLVHVGRGTAFGHGQFIVEEVCA